MPAAAHEGTSATWMRPNPLAQADGVPGRAGGQRRGPGRGMPPEVTEKGTRSVRLGAKEGFELATGVGDITITGVPGDMVTIDTVKRVRHQDRDAGRAILSSITIRIIERGGLVEALTEVSGRGRQEVFVDYSVSLPTRASISLKTFGGTVRITNVKGEIRAEAPSGDMILSSVGRVRKAKTFGGNMTITDAEGEEVIAETLGGTLVARNLKARTIELGTFTGDMLVTDALCERCALKSVSGDIEFAGPLTMGGRYELQSNSGDVRLIPSGKPSFDLEARSIGGRLHSDFQPLKPNPTAPPQRGILRGSYGEGGGAILSLTSFTGNVSVIRR
jgi:hypothetical protein